MNDLGRANEYLRANLWPTGTRVQLMSVPWDAEYRDVVAWESPEARDKWFEDHMTEAWTEVNFNYLRPNQPIKVPVPYSSAYKYNYIAVTNPAQPVDDEGPVRTYYYFITSTEYISPQATALTVQLDVMTTYAGLITMGRAFVERGHIAVANENLSAQTYNEYLTVPEGLDCGAQYLPIHTEFFNALGPKDITERAVVVISTADLTKDPGNTSSPKLTCADGAIFDDCINGCNVYVVDFSQVTALMKGLQDTSWVAQCIIDMYIVPAALVEVNKESPKYLFGKTGGVKLYTDVTSKHETIDPEGENVVYEVADIYNKIDPAGSLPDKMKCYPYTVIELSSMTGNPIFLKPELLTDSSLKLLSYGQASAPGPQFCVFPANYERNQQRTNEDYEALGTTVRLPYGSGTDNGVWLTDFPHITIVNNQYQLYLASTANTRAYNYASAGWGLDKANMSAANSYKNSNMSALTAYGNASAANDLAQDIAGENRVMSHAKTAVNGAMGIMGGGGVVKTAVNAGMDAVGTELGYNQSMRQLGTQRTAIENNYSTASAINDNNYQLAGKVAQGDYQMAIAGINAAVQDAALTSPAVVGQSGGNMFNVVNEMLGVRITIKQVGGAAKRTLVDYFRRYGYGVRRWLDCGTVYDMLCMSKFAYWKMEESSITCGSANETERMAIRGVFEKGVTLWAKPELIGNADLTNNEPKPGYRY